MTVLSKNVSSARKVLGMTILDVLLVAPVGFLDDLPPGLSSRESALLDLCLCLCLDADSYIFLLLDLPLRMGLRLLLSCRFSFLDLDLRSHLLAEDGGDLSGNCGGDFSLSLLRDLSPRFRCDGILGVLAYFLALVILVYVICVEVDGMWKV